jgi:hypothetical protein
VSHGASSRITPITAASIKSKTLLPLTSPGISDSSLPDFVSNPPTFPIGDQSKNIGKTQPNGKANKYSDIAATSKVEGPSNPSNTDE